MHRIISYRSDIKEIASIDTLVVRKINILVHQFTKYL